MPRTAPHPGFVDMSGKMLFGGSLSVLARETNTRHGHARWRVKFQACGHEDVYEGLQLRDKKTLPKCRICIDRDPWRS